MVRQISRLTALGIALLASACSITTPQGGSAPGSSSAAHAGAPQGEDAVVENLVSDAAELGFIDIGTPSAVPALDASAHESEDALHIIEPVVPTVPMSANRVVELAINDYLQNRQWVLRTWIERSHTYFPMIEQVFEEEGIPDELKYIAVTESGLQPTAGSSKGAMGMWQFMAATGRSEGLQIDAWVDERRDPEKATRAAANHMKTLYASYGNRWHLALAGYNCSFRCISRAVKRAGGSIEEPPSYWEIYPYLPRETRDFIPKYIATALIMSDPEKYGISAESFGEPLSYDVVEVQGMLSLEDAADFAGISLATLKLFNPELIATTLPDRLEPYPLRIPVNSYERFVSAFNAAPSQDQVIPGEYVVKSGDTLGRIAQEFDTTVREIQAANGIDGHLIRINQKLLIPGAGMSSAITLAGSPPRSVAYGEASYRPIKLTEEYQLVELEGSSAAKPMYAVSLSVQPDEQFVVVPTRYKVRRGDTLGAIAGQFNVTVNNIQEWNDLGNSTLIRAGQELTLHAGATTNAPAPAARQYQVQHGDNLYSIARRFGVSVDNIMRWNGLSDNVIYPGQSLSLN